MKKHLHGVKVMENLLLVKHYVLQDLDGIVVLITVGLQTYGVKIQDSVMFHSLGQILQVKKLHVLQLVVKK